MYKKLRKTTTVIDC